jgi:Rrf2 family protein
MLSQRSRYALRAMLFLAHAPRSPMRSTEIATATKISPKFLENILVELRKAGLLISNRGCRGGYILARPASQISFADIVRVTDGSLALAPCANELAPGKCEDCPGEDRCRIRQALVSVREKTHQVLNAYDLTALRML